MADTMGGDRGPSRAQTSVNCRKWLSTGNASPVFWATSIKDFNRSAAADQFLAPNSASTQVACHQGSSTADTFSRTCMRPFENVTGSVAGVTGPPKLREIVSSAAILPPCQKAFAGSLS